jgi:hypothetical protein
MQVHNKIVRDAFADTPTDDDITTPRGSLKVACTLRDNDSALMTALRYMLFYYDLGQARALHPEIYGIPTTVFQEIRAFKPHVKLYFQEDREDVDDGYQPVRGEVSFRVMNETSESMTPSEVTRLRNEVRRVFETGNGYVWKKGRLLCNYVHKEKGYQFQLLCRSETEAKDLIGKILSVNNDTPQWKRLNVSANDEPSQAYPIIPETVNILGERRRMPRHRPLANVRFQYAELNLYGMKKPIILCDRSGTFHNVWGEN